jgi:hypothetical protein
MRGDHRKLSRKEEEENYTIHWTFQFYCAAAKIGPFKQETREE